MSSEGLLRERVNKYYADLNPRSLWALSSEDFKRDTTEQEYIEYIEKNNYMKEFADVTFSIVDVSMIGNKARVKMRFQGKVIATGELFDDILYDYWIYERGNWYMDDPNRSK